MTQTQTGPVAASVRTWGGQTPHSATIAVTALVVARPFPPSPKDL